MTQRRALVIGGSIGGLFAAHLLRQAGWDVALFERSAGDLADRGAGLGVSSELFTVMRRVGLSFDRALSSYVRTSAWLRQDGSIGGEIPRAWHSSAWGIIYQPLRNAFPAALYHAGKTIARVEQDNGAVTAIFGDGTRERGDLLVAADGVFSTVRRQYLPDLAPQPAGYVAWRGMIDEKDLPESAGPVLLHRSAFSLPEGEFAVSLVIPGPDNDLRPGHRRYYFIWYRGADAAAQQDLFTDINGKQHGLSIAPPLIRAELIAAMKAAARNNLPPLIGEIVGRVAQPMLQSITDMEAPQLVFGRVALLGDSAFVARPHVAAGTTKAALDAAGLVDALAAQDDIDAALKIYERERIAFGHALISHARYLGAYLEAPPDARPARDPEQILREYGAPHLVHNDEE